MPPTCCSCIGTSQNTFDPCCRAVRCPPLVPLVLIKRSCGAQLLILLLPPPFPLAVLTCSSIGTLHYLFLLSFPVRLVPLAMNACSSCPYRHMSYPTVFTGRAHPFPLMVPIHSLQWCLSIPFNGAHPFPSMVPTHSL